MTACATNSAIPGALPVLPANTASLRRSCATSLCASLAPCRRSPENSPTTMAGPRMAAAAAPPEMRLRPCERRRVVRWQAASVLSASLIVGTPEMKPTATSAIGPRLDRAWGAPKPADRHGRMSALRPKSPSRFDRHWCVAADLGRALRCRLLPMPRGWMLIFSWQRRGQSSKFDLYQYGRLPWV
jgi:hypothetical protein